MSDIAIIYYGPSLPKVIAELNLTQHPVKRIFVGTLDDYCIKLASPTSSQAAFETLKEFKADNSTVLLISEGLSFGSIPPNIYGVIDFISATIRPKLPDQLSHFHPSLMPFPISKCSQFYRSLHMPSVLTYADPIDGSTLMRIRHLAGECEASTEFISYLTAIFAARMSIDLIPILQLSASIPVANNAKFMYMPPALLTKVQFSEIFKALVPIFDMKHEMKAQHMLDVIEPDLELIAKGAERIKLDSQS